MATIPSARRLLRAMMYAFFAASGLSGLFVPAPTLTDLLGVITYVWSGFMLLGGLLGAVGSISDRWIGELTAIPLLTSALFVYGIGLWVTAPTVPTRIAVGALMLASAAGLAARWRDVYALSKLARQPQRN